jgi:hypothetical protein
MLLISSYFLTLLFLTIVIELVVAYLFGLRKKIEIITIIFINCITNPILNYLLLVNNYFFLFKTSLFIILFLEFIVILVEWKLLVFSLQEKSMKLLMLSLVMNFCSYTIGILFF